MKKQILLSIAMILISAVAQASSNLKCAKEVEDSVTKSIEGASVLGMSSRGGRVYIVNYFFDGADAENQSQAKVTVNPQTCSVLKVEQLSE